MHNIVGFLAVLVVLIAGLGLAAFGMLIGEAKSAPQEAALSAMVMAPVVCIYVFARGIEMMASSKKDKS